MRIHIKSLHTTNHKPSQGNGLVWLRTQATTHRVHAPTTHQRHSRFASRKSYDNNRLLIPVLIVHICVCCIHSKPWLPSRFDGCWAIAREWRVPLHMYLMVCEHASRPFCFLYVVQLLKFYWVHNLLLSRFQINVAMGTSESLKKWSTTRPKVLVWREQAHLDVPFNTLYQQVLVSPQLQRPKWLSMISSTQWAHRWAHF